MERIPDGCCPCLPAMSQVLTTHGADVAQLPQLLSDQPSHQNRADALVQHIHQNPSVFGKFNPDSRSAARFAALERAPEVFLR